MFYFNWQSFSLSFYTFNLHPTLRKMVFNEFLLFITQILTVFLPLFVCFRLFCLIKDIRASSPQAGILQISNRKAGQRGSGERGGMDMGVLNSE